MAGAGPCLLSHPVLSTQEVSGRVTGVIFLDFIFTLSVCLIWKGSMGVVSFVCEGKEHCTSSKKISYLNRMRWQNVSLVDTQDPRLGGGIIGPIPGLTTWELGNLKKSCLHFSVHCCVVFFFFYSLIKLRKVFTAKNHCKDSGNLNRNWSKSWQVWE